MATISCPICGGSFDMDVSLAAPFCSDRCRQIDLGRWFDEKYILPIERETEIPEDGDQA